ncbi:MAG: sterol carrier protein domain-containing protein, partial [Jatrophihabitantaceae bacterium]
YWPASFGSNYSIRSSPGLTIRTPSAPVEVVQVEPAELLEHAIAVHARVRRQRAGQIDRDRPYWLRRLGLEGHRPAGSRELVCVIARGTDGDGSVDAYATWSANDGDWYHEYHDQAQAMVTEALAATPDSYLALWQYLLGLDLIRVLSLDAYPVDEPLEWLLSDGRAARRTWTGDNDWLRLLDVPAALSARRYGATDRLVLDVIDRDAGGWAHGKVELDAGPEHAQCRPAATATADLSLSQRGLAAIYLGGNPVRSQQLAGLIDEHTPGALDRLQAMFATSPAPWNATPF